MAGQFRRAGTATLAQGLSTGTDRLLLEDGETPDCLNVDFDRGSVRPSRGALKFGNQTAPRPGLLTGTAAGSSFPVLPGKSAPLRGAVYIPYDEAQDVGGDTSQGTSSLAAPNDAVWHTRRGRSFEVRAAFRIPSETALHQAEVRGALTNVAPGSTWDLRFGFDQALDQFTAIFQKGGDRLTPMSFAVGIVNTGNLFDIDAGGGLNVFGIPTATHEKRVSNYALCLIWLDSPGWGIHRPVQCRYRLDSGSIYSDESAHVSSSFGRYSTLAYRAIVAPFFVEPGADYRFAWKLSLDTGTPGSGNEPGVDGDPVAWNGDGWIELAVQRDFGGVELFRYDAASPASATLYRYKGPSDSLEYFTKYGVRYFGRDACFVGLGYRFAPWASAGFVPFGIDSAPLENGGFSLTDLSAHGVSGGVALAYAERLRPEEEISASNPAASTLYDLRLAHDTTGDPAGTKFEISQRGLVHHATAPGCTWGNQAGVWAAIGVQGKNPWAPHGQPWAGLGGVTAAPNSGYNDEALKSYRLVFATGSNGFQAYGASGGILSIDKYVDGAPYGGALYSQHVTVEGGSAFLSGSHPDFGEAGYTLNGSFFVALRAFRWDQIPIVVSDVRVYRKPDESVEDLARESLPGDPGLENLVGRWAMSDGGERRMADSARGNDAYLLPLGTTSEDGRGLFLSGEGEALTVDLAENQELALALRDALRDGRSGFAIQISMRLPEASYGIGQRINDFSGQSGTDSTLTCRFSPALFTWDVERPDRFSADGAAAGLTELDPVDGHTVRHWPLIELGHAVEVPFTTGFRPFLYPLGFSLKVNPDVDHKAFNSRVPPGLEAWSSATVSRWSRTADWVGRRITLQIGLRPTGVADEYRVYIAAHPKQALNPEATDPGDAEFAYFATTTIYKRDLERSRLVFGGAWNPKLSEYRDPAVGWQARGRGALEISARVILEEIAWAPVSVAGDLPASSGGVVQAGRGPIGAANFEANEIAASVAALSRTLQRSSGAPFRTTNPWDDAAAVARTMLLVDSAEVAIARPDDARKIVPRVFFCSAATADALTISRPWPGAARRGAAVRSARWLLRSTFGKSDALEAFAVGGGRTFDPDTTTTRDALISAECYANELAPALPLRLRVYSSVASGSSRDLLPRAARGAQRSRGNAIRGLYGFNDQLYAGAQGSLFEVDDRWRGEGRLAFRVEGDRVAWPDEMDLGLTSLASYSSLVVDSRVQVAGLDGTRTILWFGDADSDPSRPSPRGGLVLWTRLEGGHPELAIGADDPSDPRGVFVARALDRVRAGRPVHVRWELFLDNSETDLQRPVCWIDGVRSSVALSPISTAATHGPDPWIPKSAVASLGRLAFGAAHALEERASQKPVASAASDVSRVPILGNSRSGWIFGLDGILEAVQIGTAAFNAPGFARDSDFDADAIDYLAPGFVSAFEAVDGPGYGHLAVGYVGGATTFGTIMASPFISLTHELGRDDGVFSFASSGSEVYVTNGAARPGVVEDGVFRFAGLLPPAYAPTAEVVRTPLWEANRFVRAPGDPDNAPILDVEGNPISVTTSTPAVTKRCFGNRNPGTGYLAQASESAMAWGPDKYFAFKCYFELESVSGRIPLYSRRASLQSGGPFVEVRDGYIYCGWWDVDLKEEVWVRTSQPVIRPGHKYYLYHRKFYPRGGLAAGANSFWTPAGSNWANSVHTGVSAGVTKTSCYDALIWREIPRSPPSTSDYFAWTGHDLKSFRYPAFNYFANGSSPRACVSATLADSDFSPTDPYALRGVLGPDGIVMFEAALDETLTSGDVVALDLAATNFRFLLDHVGMLLQVTDGSAFSTHHHQAYRIVEFIDHQRVRVITPAGLSPGFSFIAADAARVTVFTGTSLVKSANYDRSRTPDPADYAVELFGSSLAANPLNGVQPFDGRRWSFAYGIFQSDGTNDGGGNKTGQPDIFEDASTALVAEIASCSEVGTDFFGLQGSTNPLDGSLPCQGIPAGELHVNAAHTAVDTQPYHAITWGAAVGDSTAPASTQPNAAKELALDVASSSIAKPTWGFSRPAAAGRRYARITFVDVENDEESAPGERLTIQVPSEDSANPSSAVSIVFSGLPVSVDRGRRISRRIRMSVAGGTDLFTAAEVDDPRAASAEVRLDDVLMQQGGAIDVEAIAASLGAPPRARIVAFSQGRLFLAGLEDQEDGVAFSLAYSPGIVPPQNVFPVDTGESGITGLVELAGAMVVLKRDAVMAYTIDADERAVLERGTRGDGCTSQASIAKLEDRVYYMSDRGPVVLLAEGWTPFFLGWRLQGLIRDTLDVASFARSVGGINRQRGQYHVTAARIGDPEGALRIGVEFIHPMVGEDTLRAELIRGHRYSLYEHPTCTALGSVQPRGGGPPRMIFGTADGFCLWADDDRTRLMGMAQDPDLRPGLEGTLGAAGILERRWSTKEWDASTPELDKVVYYLDVSRRPTAGALTIDCFRNRLDVAAGSVQLDLTKAFSSDEVGSILQESRSFRFLFRTSDDVDFELLNLVVRPAEVDSR
jgi:hypothetical protein